MGCASIYSGFFIRTKLNKDVMNLKKHNPEN